MKVNLHKTEFAGCTTEKDRIKEVVWEGGCNKGVVPFKYMGVPLVPRYLQSAEWQEVAIKMEMKLDVWKGTCYLYAAD